MGRAIELKAERRLWRVPSLEERADIAERHKADTLLICPDPWAIRHVWINRETGEVQRARCNRWECLHCGPRKVDLWRQLVKQAEPVLFLTLTKAGKTIEEAARALTTFIQALRRGSKGKGPNHIGARLAYLIEYFAVLERHKDFERNGFHWHLLIKGVDYIPYKEVIQPLWMSATHYKPETEEEEGQGAKIAHIEPIRNARAIGYVTKYLTKAVTLGDKGTREVKRERTVVSEDEQGNLRLERQMVAETVTSKAHRIRYSRSFFPEKVSELRKRLFAGMEQAEDGKPLEHQEESEVLEKRSAWMLVDQQEDLGTQVDEYRQRRIAEVVGELGGIRGLDAKEYEKRKRLALAAVMEEVREMARQEYRRRKRGALLSALEEDRQLSRRVIHVWHYQRQQLRLVG